MMTFKHDSAVLKHGGDVASAARKYQRPIEQWLDMSTGISPWAYPVPGLSVDVWRNLPPPTDNLLSAASEYYQVDQSAIIPTPGSQVSIRLLPQLLKASTVAMPVLGYQEHARSWSMAGHDLCYYRDTHELLELVKTKKVTHAVIINPNNPTGECIDRAIIDTVLAQLQGTLIVDEAFIDTAVPNKQLVSTVGIESRKLITLRSVGKFFGLAGLRIGFAVGSHPLLKQLHSLLDPWSISHASMVVTEQALRDTSWQAHQRQRLQTASDQFGLLLLQLAQCLTSDIGEVKHRIEHTLLFHTIFADKQALIDFHHRLAELGVWTRLFNEGDGEGWLRFSLPENYHEFKQRVEPVLLSK